MAGAAHADRDRSAGVGDRRRVATLLSGGKCTIGEDPSKGVVVALHAELGSKPIACGQHDRGRFTIVTLAMPAGCRRAGDQHGQMSGEIIEVAGAKSAPSSAESLGEHASFERGNVGRCCAQQVGWFRQGQAVAAAVAAMPDNMSRRRTGSPPPRRGRPDPNAVEIGSVVVHAGGVGESEAVELSPTTGPGRLGWRDDPATAGTSIRRVRAVLVPR
jgi:hypothetical protein